MLPQRFLKPDEGRQYPSEYDLGSDELQDLISRNPDLAQVYTISLATAGSLILRTPGYGFAFYGYDSSNNIYAEAYCQVFPNNDGSDPTLGFPAKHGRGFVGAFAWCTVKWPADANFGKLYIFKSRLLPWQGGIEAT